MATSLVSTGVQFPDSTTQTTAATLTSITVAAGTGLSGGGTLTTSGTLTLNNAGVTSVNGQTGAVTVAGGGSQAFVAFGTTNGW